LAGRSGGECFGDGSIVPIAGPPGARVATIWIVPHFVIWTGERSPERSGVDCFAGW
jgi:hypothetical protein